jgi:hypothetical protein
MCFGDNNLTDVSIPISHPRNTQDSVIKILQVDKTLFGLEVPKGFRCIQDMFEEGILAILAFNEFHEVQALPSRVHNVE